MNRSLTKKKEFFQKIDQELDRLTPWEAKDGDFVLRISGRGMERLIRLKPDAVLDRQLEGTVFINCGGKRHGVSGTSFKQALEAAHCMVRSMSSGTPDVVKVVRSETGLTGRGVVIVRCFGKLSVEGTKIKISSQAELERNRRWLQTHGGGLSATPVREGQEPVFIDWSSFHTEPTGNEPDPGAAEQRWYLTSGESYIPAE